MDLLPAQTAVSWARRPSALPMLKQCGCFESGGTDFAEAGSDRHAALKDHFNGDDGLLEMLPEEDQEGVRWAAEYIRLHAPVSDYPIVWETRMELLNDSFEVEMAGTPDVVCGPELFDFKWRERDYEAQMAAYALMVFQKSDVPFVRCHLLFGAARRFEILKMDEAGAREAVERILRSLPGAKPMPCDYCGWCAKKVTCPAHVEMANTVAAGREDWKLEQYHASAIDDPVEISKALKLARHLKKWCEGVEYHAREMAVKKGVQIPGFITKPKAGRKFCADVSHAFQLLGLPQEEFLKSCDLRLNTSKKYPDKKGVTELYAAQNVMKTAPAKREVTKKLESVLKQGSGTISLVAVGASETEEEES